MKEIRLLKEKGRGEKGEMTPTAATAIQRVWRGFIARRETKRRKKEEMLLIGMELPPYVESKAMKQAEVVRIIYSFYKIIYCFRLLLLFRYLHTLFA